MSVEYICDGCGNIEKGIYYETNPNRGWVKPEHWFQRIDKDGPQDACSRECIQKIARKSGKTDLVLPI